MSTILNNLLEKYATPIGVIPAEYKHLDTLCTEANIGYKDCSNIVPKKDENGVVEKNGPLEELHYRRWFVVLDETARPRRRKTPTGRIVEDKNNMRHGTLDYSKFCAVLDFIEWRGEMNMQQNNIGGKLQRDNVLDVAIGESKKLILGDGSSIDISEKVQELKGMNYAEVVKELGTMGMRKYRDIKVNSSSALPDM